MRYPAGDEYMPVISHNEGTENEDAARWKTVMRLSAMAPPVLAALFYLNFRGQIDFSSSRYGIAFITLSATLSTVSLILAGTYFYTYKFFADKFYFFIAIFWSANAVYLVLDLNGPQDIRAFYYSYRFSFDLLSLSSNAFLLLAIMSVGKRKFANTRWLIVSTSGAAIIYLAFACALIIVLPANNIIVAAWALPNSVISFTLLVITGGVLRERISDEDAALNGKILFYTFYLYACLQLSYPFILSRMLGDWILILYLIAQLAKVGNAIGLLGAIQSVVASMEAKKKIAQERLAVRIKEAELKAEEAKLQSKSQFMELGVLAASIKHDISTPIATMRFNIESLKLKASCT